MKTITITFFLCCLIPFSYSQIVKTSKTVATKYELEKGVTYSIDSLTIDTIKITIDYLNKTFTILDNENGVNKLFTYNITYHYPQNSGILFNLESNINTVCTATINYYRTEYTICTKLGEKNFIADNYQGNSVIIKELNLEYKAVYEAEFENNEAHMFNFALLEGKWLKIEGRDTIEMEFVFNEESYNLPSYCNDSIKVGISGKQLYYVKGFGIKKQNFYVCIGTGAHVMLTLKEGCLVKEYLIRSLTETEIILFTGIGVERLIKK